MPAESTEMTSASTPPTAADTAAEPAPATATGTEPAGRRSRPGRAAYLPGWAGLAYLVAWIAGLAAWPVNLALTATAAQTAASFAAHPAEAATQFLLVEGLAGLLLGVVLAFAVGAGPGAPPAVRARPAAVLGAVAVVISVTQCALGLILIAAATRHDASRAGDLSALVNRLDGLKMLALAGTAGWLAARGRMPGWLRLTAALTAVSLLASGITYLLLAGSLAWTAYCSGSLLLLWIAATGGWLAISARPRR
jgi:hypothetical protein